MKKFIKSVMLWSAVICLIPFAANADNAGSAQKANELSAVSSESMSNASQLILPSDKLKIYTSNGIRTVTVEEYTVYAVLEEIPYIMDTEAMKAQACAARTYAVRRILSGEDPSTGAHITDDGDKYQICLTDVQAREIYGESYSAAISAAQSAADSTCGEVITYHGSPISAPFHLSSGEYTLSSESAWGKAFPYLVPAKNPEAAVFCSEKTFTSAELRARLSADFPAAGELDHIALTHIDGTEAVLEANLCGITVSGEDMARILSLESSAFTVSEEGDKYIFTVTGSGHLVGMSMAGADAMSQDGCGYGEILAHYYTGTEVERVVYGE